MENKEVLCIVQDPSDNMSWTIFRDGTFTCSEWIRISRDPMLWKVCNIEGKNFFFYKMQHEGEGDFRCDLIRPDEDFVSFDYIFTDDAIVDAILLELSIIETLEN